MRDYNKLTKDTLENNAENFVNTYYDMVKKIDNGIVEECKKGNYGYEMDVYDLPNTWKDEGSIKPSILYCLRQTFKHTIVTETPTKQLIFVWGE